MKPNKRTPAAAMFQKSRGEPGLGYAALVDIRMYVRGFSSWLILKNAVEINHRDTARQSRNQK